MALTNFTTLKYYVNTRLLKQLELFLTVFLPPTVCNHPSNHEASLVLARSSHLAQNRTAELIHTEYTVTASGHKQRWGFLLVFVFWPWRGSYQKDPLVQNLSKKNSHIAVITRKETRKVISDKDIWLGRLVEQRDQPNIPRTNLTAASRLTATAHAHLLLPRNSSLQKGEVRHLTHLSSEDIKE